MEEQRVRGWGIELHVVTAGSPDRPPLLMLHGWPESYRGWQALVPHLESDYFLMMPDMRGFGRSDLPEGVNAYRMGPAVGDAVAVLDHFGVGEAGVVGHDFGGVVAWALGALAADRVRRMVVLSSPHPMRFREAALADRRQLQKGFYAWLMNIGLAGERLLASNDFHDLTDWAFGGSPGVDEDKREAYRTEWRRPGVFHAMAEWYRANYSPDLFNPDVPLDLRPVTVPVRYVHAEHDVAFVEGLHTGSGRWVDAEFDEHVVSGASHWVIHEHPEEVARLIREWMGAQ